MSHSKLYSSFSKLGPQKKENPTYEVMEVQNAQHKNQILNDHSIVCVCLSGDWCMPCKALAPSYAKLAEMYTSSGRCMLVKENVDLDLTKDFGITAIPAFAFYKNGRPVRESETKNLSIIGGDLNKVEAILRKLLGIGNEDIEPTRPDGKHEFKNQQQIDSPFRGPIQGGPNIRKNTSTYQGQNFNIPGQNPPR